MHFEGNTLHVLHHACVVGVRLGWANVRSLAYPVLLCLPLCGLGTNGVARRNSFCPASRC